ncbi:MAG: hypothetical protein ACKVJU_13150 [Verrucomicrobiales bacterium]
MKAAIIGYAWFTCVLILVSGCDGFVLGRTEPNSSRDPGKLIGDKPIAAHTLPTRETLEIFAVEAGDVPLRLRYSTLLPTRSGGNEWNSGSWDTSGNLLTFNHKPDKGGLNIVCRLTDADGAYVVPNYPSAEWAPYQKEVREVPRNKSGDFTRDRLGGKPKESARDGYWLEFDDGNGEWLPMRGAYVPSAKDGRGFVSSSRFPRYFAKLKLRLVIAKGGSYEFKVDNPAYQPPEGQTWKAKPGPFVEQVGPHIVQVAQFGESTIPPSVIGNDYLYRSAPFPRYSVVPIAGQPADAVRAEHHSMMDESGNSGRRMAIFGKVAALRYTARIHMTDKYLWQRKDVTLIATGKAEANGEMTILKVKNPTHKWTLDSLEMDRENGGNWHFRIAGAGDRNAIFPTQLGLGIFKNRETKAVQIRGGGRSGGGDRSGSGAEQSFEWKYSLEGFEFKPGNTIEIGLFPTLEPVFVDFTVPVTSLQKHRGNPAK